MAVIWHQLRGHEALKKKLGDAAHQEKLAHALLFAGPSGVGKRHLALGLAQMLLCERQGPCGECGPCQRVENQRFEGLMILEPQAGVIKIEMARSVRDFLALRTWSGRRVVLINEAHALNPQAANALLKSLEEPPEGTYFLLVTGQERALLPTIRSRCQIVRVAPLSRAEIAASGDFPEWVLSASFGQLGLAQNLASEESANVRRESVKLWAQLMRAERPADSEHWRDRFRDREEAQRVLEMWSVLLHRARRKASGADVAPGDEGDVLTQLASRPTLIDRAWLSLVDLKRELEAHVEAGLALDGFWYRVTEAAR